jgi:hypothetical protein
MGEEINVNFKFYGDNYAFSVRNAIYIEYWHKEA